MLTEIRKTFDALRKLRLGDQIKSLESVGVMSADCISLLQANCDLEDIGWKGKGTKSYGVFHPTGSADGVFSRAVRKELWIGDRVEFEDLWAEFVTAMNAAKDAKDKPTTLPLADSRAVDRMFYTSVVGFGAAVDLFGAGDRSGPGTFFEMVVGPTISLLTGRAETGAVVVDVPGAPGETDRVPVDLSFLGTHDEIALVVPTKISTRERISQAYVHQAILNTAGHPIEYRSVLCIGNENNMVREDRSAAKSFKNAFVTDTLVPSTIVQYQRYIAELDGLYYLDPPEDYLKGKKSGFPNVGEFATLLTTDLPALLTV